MEGLWSAVIGIAVAAVALLVVFNRRQQSKWPPGPPTLPIIGNLHQLAKGGDVIHVALAKLARAHGPIMTVWFGSWQPNVVVSDYETVWEVLVSKSPDFAARALPSLTSLVTADFRTVVSSDSGPYWQALRKGLTSSALAPPNLNNQGAQQELDAARLIAALKQEVAATGGVVKPYAHIRRASIRLIARLIFGPDFSNDAFDHGMDELIEENLSFQFSALLVHALPFTRHFPGVRRTANLLNRKVPEFLRPYIPQAPSPNSYVHFLLSQGYPEDVVLFAIFEIFVLAIDSTGSTTLWALALLVHNSEVQQKLYEEIRDTACKNDKGVVKIEELGKLQYLQAVVKETMRIKPIAPLAVPHKTARETELRGMRVPEGTCVLVNLYALHYDPKVWEEPERFKPERFLEKKGGEQISYMPFGGGMRICAGMEVGKLQLAFLIANLVNAFEWKNSVHGKLPDLSEDVNFVLGMKNPLEARILPRQ